MPKKAAAVLFMGIFLVFSMEAAMVSFVIIETGLPEDGGKIEHSRHWEDAIFDVFFDAGHIVSNAPMMRLDSKPTDEIQKLTAEDIFEARMGGADYFIIAQLDYFSDVPKLNEISFIMYRISPYKKIHEKRVSGKTYKTQKEEVEDLKLIARGLIPLIKN